MTTINPTPAPLEVPPPPEMPGINVLLMGPAGTGKTHSIGTLVDTGLEVFYLALEPGLESLKGYYTDQGKPIPPNLHWHTLAASTTSFLDMAESAKKVNTLSVDALSKMVDPKRSSHNQFIGLLTALSDFPDDRTGKKFGAVDSWRPDRVLVTDGLTGVNNASMAMLVGGKPVKSQSDWGMAQDQVERLLRKLCEACACHFVLLSHVERETDLINGGSKITVATLGKALAPKIPSMFSDVILTSRNVTTWTWDTANPMADLKTRNLPIKSDNKPDFGPIIAKWRARKDAE